MEITPVSFEFGRLRIPEVILVKATAFPDERGVFVETYKRSDFQANGIAEEFVQDNYSRSARGVLRGLHFQDPPNAQGKLVSVIRGEIFDVAVDIRRESPTYAQWIGLRMSSEAHASLYVPVGFAHGFQVLSEEADVTYKVTEEYSPEADRGIVWDDPELKITWPIREALVSAKDANLPRLADTLTSFRYAGRSN